MLEREKEKGIMLLLGYLKKKNQNTNYNQKFKVTDLMKCSIFEEDQG